MNSNRSQDFDPYKGASMFDFDLGTTRMVNPDGSITIRTKVLNPDGSFSFKEEEHHEINEDRKHKIPPEESKPEQPSFDSKTSDAIPSLQFSDESDSLSSLTQTKMDLSLFSTASSKDDVFAGIDFESPQRSSLLMALPLSARVEEYTKKEIGEHYSIPLSRRVEDYSPSRKKGQEEYDKKLMLPPLPAQRKGYVSPPSKMAGLHDFIDPRENSSDPFHDINTTPPRNKAVSHHEMYTQLPPPTTGLNIRERTDNPVYEYDWEKRRDAGLLVDSEGYVENNHQIEVSVYKKTKADKIGINVGLVYLGKDEGSRLIVTKVSPNGLFANSPIQEGDIVVSINSSQFLNEPSTEHALSIVSEAVGRIAFVVRKRGRADGSPLHSPPGQKVQEKVGSEVGKTVTREIWNADGSLTLVVDQHDEGGNRVRREIRRVRMNADDGKILDTSLDSSSTGNGAGSQPRRSEDVQQKLTKLQTEEVKEEKKVEVKEEEKKEEEEKSTLQQKTVVVRKNRKSQKIGLIMDTLKTSKNGRVIFVSGVDPAGLIAQAQTSLALGDIILSINDFDFCKNPNVDIASSIIINALGDITIVAKEAEESFADFSKMGDDIADLAIVYASKADSKATGRASLDFDEMSYGGSIGSYMSSKILKLEKSEPTKHVGLNTMAQLTQWGVLLVVSELTGKLASSDLRVGDTILSINGISFKGKPDPSRATYILEKAAKHITIEYQRLPEVKKSTGFKKSSPKKMELELPGWDSRKSRSIEEFDAGLPAKKPSPTKSDKSYEKPEKSGSIGRLNSSFLQSPTSPSPQSDQNLITPAIIPPMSDTLLVRATKSSPDQEVGISIEKVNGKLYVSKISLRGILVGRNIIPGDIILSINDKGFTENPSLKEAYSEIKKAPKILIFEVQKPMGEPTGGMDAKLKWHDRLSCGRN